MFEIKKYHSRNNLADLFKLPPRKGLKSSTYSPSSRIPSYFLHFPTVFLTFMQFFFPNLTSFTSLLSLRKALKTFLFKLLVAEFY